MSDRKIYTKDQVIARLELMIEWFDLIFDPEEGSDTINTLIHAIEYLEEK